MKEDKNYQFELLKLFYERVQKFTELLIKFHGFYFLISGAIISFSFLHITIHPFVKYALFFPIVIGLISLVFLFYERNQCYVTIKEIDDLSKTLELTPPNLDVVNRFLNFSIILYLSVVLGLVIALFLMP